jgi:hypothetical protein
MAKTVIRVSGSISTFGTWNFFQPKANAGTSVELVSPPVPIPSSKTLKGFWIQGYGTRTPVLLLTGSAVEPS